MGDNQPEALALRSSRSFTTVCQHFDNVYTRRLHGTDLLLSHRNTGAGAAGVARA